MRRLLIAVCLVAAALALPGCATTPPSMPAPPAPARALFMIAITPRDADDVTRLLALGVDVLEGADGDTLYALGDDVLLDGLRAAGFRASIAESTVERMTAAGPADTFFAGYHSVAEHERHLEAVQAARPDLAVIINYGLSWTRSLSPTQGYALKALCITRRKPGDCALVPGAPKPRLLVLAGQHPRELATSEIAWRLIDLLIQGDGQDPDLATVLDTTEVWVIPLTNPDGRAIVERGGDHPLLQRKNANALVGSCPLTPTVGVQIGVDLNRNSSFHWGEVGGATNPCSALFRGASPASEPETAALERLLGGLFADQRGIALTDTAPLTASGLSLNLHAFGDEILVPWSFSTCGMRACPAARRAPNDTGLRQIAFRLAADNGYTVGQPGEVLYPMSGTTDDYAYGALGVPAFTIEIGPSRGPCGGFTPAYGCVDAQFWPQQRTALIEAARLARQPYALAQGPRISVTSPVSLTVRAGESVTLTAVVDDGLAMVSRLSVGRPAAQPIALVEVSPDTLPWLPTARPQPAVPVDGRLDGPREAVRVVVNTRGWATGRHTLYWRARDGSGAWGTTTAVWVNVTR